MAGIHLLEMIGAFIRWLFSGCKRPYNEILEDEKNHSIISKNFIIGIITFFTILFILYKINLL